MFVTYVWKAHNISEPDARAAFSAVMDRERALFTDTWGRAPVVSEWREGPLFVGQLRYDLAITGLFPWVDHGDRGMAWGGICESHLGNPFDREGVASLREMLSSRPQELASWDGRFSVVVWERTEPEVIVCTGATQSPTLWWTEGPKGWAMGTRAAPILDLVERPKAPNTGEIGLFLAYGYLLGHGCLFQGVDRVPSRSRITFDGRNAPSVLSYMSVLDVGASQFGGWKKRKAIDICRERLIHRVAVEHQATESPTILLTGGRDSRAIAAAASRSRFAGVVHSGGAPDSSTVQVAGLVADALGMERHPEWADGSFRADLDPVYSLQNLQLWTRASEGIETIRHALTWRDFFARSLPFPPRCAVEFHGLAGAVGKGAMYRGLSVPALRKARAAHIARDHLRSKARRLWYREDLEVPGRLEEVFDRFERSLGGPVTVAAWLELFHWQRTVLQWGEDLVQVKSQMRWLWTPLHDRELFRVFLSRRPEEKYGGRFFEELTVALAPELRGVPYDQRAPVPPGLRGMLTAARRRMARLRRRFTGAPPWTVAYTRPRKPDHAIQAVWTSVFGVRNGAYWSEIIDEATLRQLIRTDPNSEALWNLATVDLFMQTFFGSSGSARNGR